MYVRPSSLTISTLRMSGVPIPVCRPEKGLTETANGPSNGPFLDRRKTERQHGGCLLLVGDHQCPAVITAARSDHEDRPSESLGHRSDVQRVKAAGTRRRAVPDGDGNGTSHRLRTMGRPGSGIQPDLLAEFRQERIDRLAGHRSRCSRPRLPACVDRSGAVFRTQYGDDCTQFRERS